ncbi:MAG: acyltransferase [Gemmatimonadota bacterium]|nr:acyltransferase [Gemmatimonadota bacterium]
MTDRSFAELRSELERFHWERQRELLEKWNRSLPFGDGIVDRWERAKFLGFGEGASIYDSAVIIGDVKVGENTWIGPATVLDGSGGLTIGSYCSISAGVHIYSHDSVKWALSGGVAEYERAPVSIGSNTYIGPMTIVGKGVRIGEHCLVGANSVVNKDLRDFSIAYGTTCRVVGKVRVSGKSVQLLYNEDP